IATETRNGIALAYAGAQARRGLLQQGVTHFVAERVVDDLEVVEIKKHQRQPTTGAICLLHLFIQTVLKHASVGQGCERIKVCLLPDKLFSVFLLLDVGELAYTTLYTAITVINRVDRKPLRINFAVLAPVENFP